MPAIGEEPSFQLFRVDVVMQANRGDAALDFIQWVFAIPNPNAPPLDRLPTIE
jgi:hypothetical protein